MLPTLPVMIEGRGGKSHDGIYQGLPNSVVGSSHKRLPSRCSEIYPKSWHDPLQNHMFERHGGEKCRWCLRYPQWRSVAEWPQKAGVQGGTSKCPKSEGSGQQQVFETIWNHMKPDYETIWNHSVSQISVNQWLLSGTISFAISGALVTLVLFDMKLEGATCKLTVNHLV